MPKRKRKPKSTVTSDVSGEGSVVLHETAPLQLRYYGDPVLRKRAEPVAEITEAECQLAEQMLETLHATGIGIGLAATQVGVLKRLIVIDIGEEDDIDEEDYEEYEPLVLFNPELLSSDGEIVAEEGCLSIPDVTADVKRPESIVVEGINLQHESIRIDADGLLARVLQHEIDHLNGVLFIDRISGLKRRLLSDELTRLQKAEKPY